MLKKWCMIMGTVRMTMMLMEIMKMMMVMINVLPPQWSRFPECGELKNLT